MPDLPTLTRQAYDATLEAMRDDGATLPSFVPFEELTRADQCFVLNLVGGAVQAERDRCAEWVRGMLAKIEGALDGFEQVHMVEPVREEKA